jgi:hypothetical protein
MHADPSGLAHSLSPVDLPEPALPLEHPLRWTSIVIGVATLTLALLNAHALRGWTYELPPAASSTRAVAAAETWHDLTGRFGLNRPAAAVRERWQRLKARRFENQAPPAAASSRSTRAYSSSASG